MGVLLGAALLDDVTDDDGVGLSLGTGVATLPKYSTSLGALAALHSAQSMLMTPTADDVGVAREKRNWNSVLAVRAATALAVR